MIEVIVALVNPSRRIGDRVAGTRLVHYNQSNDQPAAQPVKWAIPVGLSYSIMLLLFTFLSPRSMAATAYSTSSYNAAESKALEQLMTDSLGQYLTPDIRIYDTIDQQPVKFVSVILNLKENYLADDNSQSQLQFRTQQLLYAQMRPESFTGKIKYVFKGSGQFQSTSSPIGEYTRHRHK
jgi:hypothetical protein